MHPYTSENSIFNDPITNLRSLLCILINVISRAKAKGGKSLTIFKSGTFIRRFPSDTLASMAMKGLNSLSHRLAD